MTGRTAYLGSRAGTLVLVIIGAASFILGPACGDDDSSASSGLSADGGLDGGDRSESKAGAGGSKAESGSGGSQVENGESKAGAGGVGGAGEPKGGTGSSSTGNVESKAGTGGSSAVAGVTVTGVVVDITEGDAARNFDSSKYPVVPNVKVCVYDNSKIPCVMTDSAGKYSLAGLPDSLDVYLSYEKDSFAPMLFKPVAETGNDMPAILMVSTAYRDSFAKAGGINPDENAGLIYFGANLLEDRGTPFKQMFGTAEMFYLNGYRVRLSPTSKGGPVYVSSDWKADASLTSSSRAGWGIIQAAPGDYELRYTHPAVTCPPVKTKVVKGYVTTYVGTVCSAETEDSDAGI